MADTSDFRNGLIIKFKHDLYSIVEFQHVKPGKGVIRGGLGVAPRDHDAGSRVGTHRAAHRLPGLHGSFPGNRAGVDDTEVRAVVFNGQGRVYISKPGIHQSFGNLLGLVLIDLAAQGGEGELIFVA